MLNRWREISAAVSRLVRTGPPLFVTVSPMPSSLVTTLVNRRSLVNGTIRLDWVKSCFESE